MILVRSAWLEGRRAPSGRSAQAGEPRGRWWGRGAEALGFATGQLVERGPSEQVYRQIDPRTGVKLGRSRGSYAKFADHLARLQAAEPHATAERVLELEREAAQATRQSPVCTGMTVSFSKSISVFHASIRENERGARVAGDEGEAARWAAIEERYLEVLQAASRAGPEYVQRWAGMTRTGYHGTCAEGREAGRFEGAEVIVTSWLQGTSRDGDPQDHIHNQIARLVRTVRDGKHRALDTICLRQVGAVQAVVATHAECGLTREFGVAWVPRADGAGNEVAGITREQMDAYSSRTVSITGRLPEAVRGVDGEVRPGAEPARAALHPPGGHRRVPGRQGARHDRLGRAGRAVGRAARRRTRVGRAARLGATCRRERHAQRTAGRRGGARGTGAGGTDARGPARADTYAGGALDVDSRGFPETARTRAAGPDPGHVSRGCRGVAARAGRRGVSGIGRAGDLPGGAAVAAAAVLPAPRARRAQRVHQARDGPLRHWSAAQPGRTAPSACSAARSRRT
jgi:hypothetical protein